MCCNYINNNSQIFHWILGIETGPQISYIIGTHIHYTLNTGPNLIIIPHIVSGIVISCESTLLILHYKHVQNAVSHYSFHQPKIIKC